MKILFAAGGTAGHVNPALAIAQAFKEKIPGAEIVFVGRQEGMEATLVRREGYPFRKIDVQGFRRSFDWESIKWNVHSLWMLTTASREAKEILAKESPDLIIGTGGYVSGPLLQAAAKQGIPTAIHEQNAYPGVTNKLLAGAVDLVFCANSAGAQRLAEAGAQGKTTVTGNPVRKEFFTQKREPARADLQVGERPMLLSFGGSLGAAPLNEAIGGLMAWHLQNRNYYHLHATGKAGKEEFEKQLVERGVDLAHPNLRVREYILSMPMRFAAADLVICRAGALTLSELMAAGRPAILIPSPHVAENHQYYNALELEQAGAAKILEEKDLTEDSLIALADELLQNSEELAEMSRKAKELAKPNAAGDVVDALLQLATGGGKSGGNHND